MEERNAADVRWEELELFRRNNIEDGLLKLQETKRAMIGAIVGDIAGSRFEFHNRKTKKFLDG